jgi:hypothetical protein
MQRSDFTLSWFALPTEQDWRSLNISGVTRVMVGYGIAKNHTPVLAHLASLGKRVVIRIADTAEDDPATAASVLRSVAKMVGVDGVILPPNEPEPKPEQLLVSSPDWGQARAWQVKSIIDVYRAAVRGAGLAAIAPALSHPPAVISEDGPPLPGRTTWREILAPSAHLCDGVASHCGYALGWQSDVDRFRFRAGLTRAATDWHRPLWIAEATYPTDDDLAQMACAIEQAEIVMRHPAGDRVRMYAPFVSAGTPGGHWDARYLLTNEASYAMLGDWMRDGR